MTASLLVGAAAPTAAHLVAAAQAPGRDDDQKRKPKAAIKQGPRQPRPKQQRPKQPEPKRRAPAVKPDRLAPAAPSLGGAWAGAGGAVSLSVLAEAGSSVVVRESGGGVVAGGTGTGGTWTFTWWASSGSHTYLVTATDPAGNRSRASTVTVTADATPPSLVGVQAVSGNRTDSRSRLTFSTEPGATYRVLVDGRVARQRFDPDGRVATFLDVGDGPHQVRVEVRDRVGNLTSSIHPFQVRIPRLAVSATTASDPTDRVQRIRVNATPNATRGVARVPGQGRKELSFVRGGATLRLRLPDGTYDGITITVRDGWRRTGTRTVPALEVDTTPPVLVVRPDPAAAEDGILRAAVSTDPGAVVEWRVLDSDGEEAASGELVASSGQATIERDVNEGSYRLEASVEDEFDRMTTTSAAAPVASDPWPRWLVVLVLLGAAAGVAGLAVPVLPRLLRRVRAARSRLWAVWTRRRTARTPVAEALEQEAVPPAWGLFVPRQRSRREAVAAVLRVAHDRGARERSFRGALPLLPGERVLHATSGRLYETHDLDYDDLALDGHDGDVVVTNKRVAFTGDIARDWWTGRIATMSHVSEDRTMLLRSGEEAWAGLGYDDTEVTRLHLDLLMAEQQGNRQAYLAGLEEEMRADDRSTQAVGRVD